MVWCSEFCDCNKNEYDERNALQLWNSQIHCCENIVPSPPKCLRWGLTCSWYLLQTCAEVSAASKFDNHKGRISEHPENALAESESTVQSSKGTWEHLEVLRSTGEGSRRVWEVCVWLPDRSTFCWCNYENPPGSGFTIQNTVYTSHCSQHQINGPLSSTSWKFWGHSDDGSWGWWRGIWSHCITVSQPTMTCSGIWMALCEF